MNKIIILTLMILLTGCSFGEKRIKIFSVEEPRAKLDLATPDALTLEEQGIDPVLFGLTDKDFEMIAKNFAQIRQKLQETNNLLEEYKKYYEPKENK